MNWVWVGGELGCLGCGTGECISVYGSPHKDGSKGCVCVLLCSHIYVEMDEGDAMSGIDPLYMAPSPE